MKRISYVIHSVRNNVLQQRACHDSKQCVIAMIQRVCLVRRLL